MTKNDLRFYRAPGSLVAVFYVFLVVWTVLCFFLLVAMAARARFADAFQWVMIVGVLFFTWYFSLGVFYRIRLEADGSLSLGGVRKVFAIHPRDIEAVEGPYLPIGFVRFKSGRERFYLLCWVKNEDLLAILKRVGEMNPNIRFKTK